MRLRTAIVLGLCATLWASPAVAGEAAPDEPAWTFTPSAQVLVRYRHTGGFDFAPGGSENFVRQRVRLGGELAWQDRVRAFVQVQDVRVWGEASDTLGDFSADGFDLHQGYLEVRLADGLDLRAGRQEIIFLNQRLIGNVDFVEQGRSFDALRLRYDTDDLLVDAFYARTLDRAEPDDPRPNDVFGAMATFRFSPAFALSAVSILDLNSNFGRVRSTSGIHLAGSLDMGLSYRAEAYLQVGGADNDVSFMAYLASARVRYTLQHPMAPFLQLHSDLVSGDGSPDDGTVRSFDTLFATNHRFYGNMDFFTNLPRDTNRRGLMDLGATLGFKPHPNVTATLVGHVFQAMESRGGPGHYGVEVDTKVVWRPLPHLHLDLLYGVFVPGEGFVGGAPSDPEHFVYSTVSVLF